MKWFVGILALLNAGYFAWIYVQENQATSRDPHAIYNNSIKPDKRLQLLSEVKEIEYFNTPSSVVKPTEQGIKNAQHIQSTAEKKQPENNISNKKQKLSKDSGTKARPGKQSQEAASSVSASFVPQKCFTVGPFADKKVANNYTKRLSGLGIESTRRETSQRDSSGFWVYMPPFSSRQQARDMQKLLRQKGVKDFLIIPGGVMKNAISLGVFKGNISAQTRVEELKEIGINALLKENFDTTILYWLDFSSAEDRPLPVEMLEDLRKSPRGLGLINRSCE